MTNQGNDNSTLLNSERFRSQYHGSDPAVDGEDIAQDALCKLLKDTVIRDMLTGESRSSANEINAEIERKFRSRAGTTRKRERERPFSFELSEPSHGITDTTITPYARVESDELQGVARTEIAKLRGLQREAMSLCYIGGLSIREATERLNVKSSTVRSALTRGKQELRSALESKYVTEWLSLGNA